MVDLQLDQAAAGELGDVLDQVLADLNYEIADTDLPSYRRGLRARRERLTEVRDQLRSAAQSSTSSPMVDS
jgi:hypothetical protein